MGDRKHYLINQIVKYAQKLDQKGFGANHDGNISVKFEDVLLATPTAVSKGNVVEDIIITLDLDGKLLAGNGKPFSEIQLHLAAYKARDDIKAVVHAHPPFATARGLVGKELRPTLPEAIVSIGDLIPVVAFAMPGAKENVEIIASALAEGDVFMLPGNGVFAVGDSVEQAYLRLELVEHLAKIDYYTASLGQPMELSAENLTKLLEKRASIGLGPKKLKILAQPAMERKTSASQLDSIKKIIADEIEKVLRTKGACLEL